MSFANFRAGRIVGLLSEWALRSERARRWPELRRQKEAASAAVLLLDTVTSECARSRISGEHDWVELNQWRAAPACAGLSSSADASRDGCA